MDPEISFKAQECSKERLTGVNRLIILAEIEGGEERHSNLRKIMEKLKLQCLPGLVLVGDLSVTNVYLGISKHGGKYACYICEGPSTIQSGKLQTFGSLKKHYKDYKADGAEPKRMQKFKNVINECLVHGEPEELVGDKLPLPELHLLIGIVNHYRKLILKIWPRLEIWERGKWTIPVCHGGGLDGVNCNK